MKRYAWILAALLPAAALAETAAQVSPLDVQKNVGTIQTFQPTGFEQQLFLDGNKITQTDGEGVYRALCQGCHMENGEGAVGAGMYPALKGNENLLVGDYPVTVIVHGQKAMPPFGDILDDDQILAVVGWLQKDFPPDDVIAATKETVEDARASAEPPPL